MKFKHPVDMTYAELEARYTELAQKPKARLSHFDCEMLETLIHELDKRDNSAMQVAESLFTQ